MTAREAFYTCLALAALAVALLVVRIPSAPEPTCHAYARVDSGHGVVQAWDECR